MQIEIKARNVEVGDELRQRVHRRFNKIAKQVSPLARMEVELSKERNPAISQSEIAEATLYLKGITLRAHESSDSMTRSVNQVADELARQVKRHRDKRRARRGMPAKVADASAEMPTSGPLGPP